MLLLTTSLVLLPAATCALRLVRRDLARAARAEPAPGRCGLPPRDLGPCPAALWWRARRPHGLHLPHAP